MNSPPYALRRTLLIWSPLLVAGAIFILTAPFFAAAWCLLPMACVVCAITHELTETKEVEA